MTETDFIMLAESAGYIIATSPQLIRHNDQPNRVSLTHIMTCPECDANQYWVETWKKGSLHLWLRWCDECHYRWLEIELSRPEAQS